ncbi:MAG: hypothetical protein GY928_35650 [Colwellia sp.]|nr:hypothetical protein [Colwellia sp.]
MNGLTLDIGDKKEKVQEMNWYCLVECGKDNIRLFVGHRLIDQTKNTVLVYFGWFCVEENMDNSEEYMRDNLARYANHF